ncbi:DUF6175 family protein [uncultured Muribaculum sp.]|uniref:DUF6175 family protein n=1 Tax=uncultured Muribaculum sp. TaxID=1918613 RepID=UPI00266F0CFE|nr:DUF6175 family protein [uncultured Muribaculum sp.]
MLLSLIGIVSFPLICDSQVKKPTIMLLPSDNWCAQRYFTQSFDNQGTTVKVSDYQRAFTEDIELPQVISKVGGVLTSMGYSLKDAEMEIKSIKVKQAEDNAISSKTSSTSIAESPLDVLKRRMKSDIVIQLWWNISKDPAGKIVSFTLEAFDSYTNKRIATATGNPKPTADAVPVALEKAVKNNVKEFDKQLDKWYDDQKKNGREIVLTVRCWDNWDNDLETEYDGEELTDCIQKWLRQNTVNSSFNLSDGTESFAQFEQVRIPLKDKDSKAMDARAFATALRKHLQKAPYNITSKVVIRGLGEAIIILGEK